MRTNLLRTPNSFFAATIAVAMVAATGLAAVRSSTDVSAQLAQPPAMTLESGGHVLHTAGIGTFCWVTGCARAIGIITAVAPLTVTGKLSATLQIGLAEAPSYLGLTTYPVTAVDEIASGPDFRAWRSSQPGDDGTLSPATRQPLMMERPPGLYVLQVSALWPGGGRDVIYGMLVNFAGPDTTATPGASSTATPGGTSTATPDASSTASPTSTLISTPTSTQTMASATPSRTPMPLPPELAVTIGGRQHAAVRGTFCWAGFCGDMPGILTQQEPVRVTAAMSATLAIGGQAAPKSVGYQVFAVDPRESASGFGNVRVWRPRPTPYTPLQPALTQSIQLPERRGWAVLHVFVTWGPPTVGDASYGLLLDYGGESAWAVLPWAGKGEGW